MHEPPFIRAFTFMLAGFIIWAVHFVWIYSVAGLLCARPEWASLQLFGMGIVHLTVALSTFAALVGVGAICLRAVTGRSNRFTITSDRFYVQMTCAIGALGAVAIVWQGLFTLLVPSCV